MVLSKFLQNPAIVEVFFAFSGGAFDIMLTILCVINYCRFLGSLLKKYAYIKSVVILKGIFHSVVPCCRSVFDHADYELSPCGLSVLQTLPQLLSIHPIIPYRMPTCRREIVR